MLKKLLLFSIVAVFLLAACSTQNTDSTVGTDVTENDKVVAVVNDENIMKSEYEVSFEHAKASYLQQGMDLDGEDVSEDDIQSIKEQVLDQLINQKLLTQEVSKHDIEVSEEEIDMEISQIKAQFTDDEEFNQALEANSLTLEELRNISDIQVL